MKAIWRGRGSVAEADLSFQIDPYSVFSVVVFLIVMVPLLVNLVKATQKREGRLRAALRAKRLKKQVEAAPDDMELLKSWKEAQATKAACKAEEDELRSVRLLGGPVIAQFGLPDTEEIRDLKCQLFGIERPRSGPTDVLVNASVVGLLLLLVPYFFLTLTDPMSTPDPGGLLLTGKP